MIETWGAKLEVGVRTPTKCAFTYGQTLSVSDETGKAHTQYPGLVFYYSHFDATVCSITTGRRQAKRKQENLSLKTRGLKAVSASCEIV